MGTPDFAVPSLKALIETQTVVGVVTQPDRPAGRGGRLRQSPVKETAVAANIPVYQPKSLRKRIWAEQLHEWQPDVIVVVAFGQILRPHVLEMPPHGCINVHASLLPRWRGASPIHHAILAGDAQTGVTLMQMDVGLDSGPMLVQQAVDISPDETAVTLHDRLAELGGEMLRGHVNDILNGRFTPTPQDDAQSTYAPMLKKDAGKLDWHKSSAELERHVRAMVPWPGAFTTWRGKNLKILKMQLADGYATVEHSDQARPGLVQNIDNKLFVRTCDGWLELGKIQLAGKRAMQAVDFARGRPEFVGSVLGE